FYILFLCRADPPVLPAFPTRRSSDLTLTLEGVLGVVRGRRTDVDDHLYRIAPPNARLALTHDAERWSATVESVLYVAQTRTSARSEEHTSELQSRENLVCRLLPAKKN